MTDTEIDNPKIAKWKKEDSANYSESETV